MSYGANQYRRSAGGALAPRETEAAAFVFINRLLSQEDDPDVRMTGLVKNQQLWSMLLKDIASSNNILPPILKSDLTTLGFWVMRETISAMGSRQRAVSALIEVNQDMIAGLRSDCSTASNAACLALAG